MFYIRVDSKPEKLSSNEMVIYKPDFLEEVKSTRQRRGVDSVASIRSIRDILGVLAEKYDNTLNPYSIKLQKYENLEYSGDKGFSDLILKVIKENNLPLINKALEMQIKARKPNVDTIYYVSDDLDGSSAFLSLGFHLKNEKQTKKNIVAKEDVV